ncbi:hypothetical protein [Pseudogemmobacter sonorensis]|uniref:hypothetical protein n=1 Tax=Pseudogemmobacter sonorensis TaxID=2989681 RepID=UPI0036C1ED79
MSPFYRLRRGVALIICPEMGVEARLKAARDAGAFDVDSVRVPALNVPFWRRAVACAARIEDSLLGDLIGVGALFALLWLGLMVGYVLGLV